MTRVGSVHSMLYSLAITHCTLLAMFNCSLIAITDDSEIHTKNIQQAMRR